MTVTTSTPTERLVLPRRWLFGALAVALAAHAALLIGWLAGLAGSGLAHLRPSEWLPAFAGVAALVLAVGLFAPRRLVCIARLFVVALACALVGPRDPDPGRNLRVDGRDCRDDHAARSCCAGLRAGARDIARGASAAHARRARRGPGLAHARRRMLECRACLDRACLRGRDAAPRRRREARGRLRRHHDAPAVRRADQS